MPGRRKQFTKKKGERREYFAQRQAKRRQPFPVAEVTFPPAVPFASSEPSSTIPLSPLIKTLRQHIEKGKHLKRKALAVSNCFIETSQLPKLEPVLLTAMTSVGAGRGCNPEGEEKWWKYGVIYQIYPRSFKDSTGNGIGDLPGITSKLDYLKDIGVSALWLSPIYPSPQVDAGYDIADFKNIDPEYGTLSDFQKLLERAKEFGLKVILDLVPNHSSNQHPWFVASENGEPKYKDYYVWRDGKKGKPPNNWVSNFRGSAWEWSERRQQYYLHQFAVEQPDLNYENPAVVEEMKNVMRFWLSRGVDGFRMDAIPYLFEDPNFSDEPLSGTTDDALDANFLSHVYTQNHPKTYEMVNEWRKVVEEFGPDKLMMTECYATLEQTIAYYGTKEKPGAHFPFNFLIITELSRSSDAKDWKKVIDTWMAEMKDGRWPNWVIGNHDNRRVAGRFGTDLADGINMISLTLPGTAVTYNGEELGMEDTFISWTRSKDPIAINKGKGHFHEVTRDPARTPMQWDDSTSAGFSSNISTWLPVNPNYWRLNVAAQRAAAHSPLKMFKDIIRARHHDTLKRGDYRTIVEGKVLIILRTLKNNPVVFVTAVNFGDEEAEFTVKDIPEVCVYTTSMNAGNLIKSSKVTWPIKLRPKAAVLLSNCAISHTGLQ